MSDVVVKILDSGPIHIIGDFEVLDGAGNPYKRRGLFSLCRCGLSNRKPYCDGAHREMRFEDACRAPVSTASEIKAG
jgi:CDGSH-type Zn-finger protein